MHTHIHPPPWVSGTVWLLLGNKSAFFLSVSVCIGEKICCHCRESHSQICELTEYSKSADWYSICRKGNMNRTVCRLQQCERQNLQIARSQWNDPQIMQQAICSCQMSAQNAHCTISDCAFVLYDPFVLCVRVSNEQRNPVSNHVHAKSVYLLKSTSLPAPAWKQATFATV